MITKIVKVVYLFSIFVKQNKMMLHTLQTTQFIKSDINTMWEFISSPKNLSSITPDYMQFEVISDLGDDNMYAGQIIEYYVRPLLGVKLHWVTEITHVKDKEYFVDEQRFGPYKFWHHKHFLKQVNGGVEMFDLVHYKLPLGLIGKIGNELLVKKQLQQVFNYRFDVIEKLFNK
jgi:ligand-binding SRPBCC domain-containing protein